MLVGFLKCAFYAERLGCHVEIIPAQRQNFVSPCARECRDSDDRKQWRSFEAMNQRAELLGLKSDAMICLARGGDFDQLLHRIARDLARARCSTEAGT